MALLTRNERVILETLRVSGRRERGGLTLDELSNACRISGFDTLALLVKLESAEYVVSALIDDGGPEVRQRRLYYMTKAAMA